MPLHKAMKTQVLAPCANEVRCRNNSKSYIFQDILFCSLTTHHKLLNPFSGVFEEVMTSAYWIHHVCQYKTDYHWTDVHKM